MKLKRHSAGGLVVCGAVAAILLSSGSAYANVKVSESVQVHNGDSLGRPATDLSYTLQVPEWEKENYWFVNYTVGTTPPIGGTVTYTPHTNTSGHVWSVDVHYTGINIPFCVTIQIDTEATLNAWNTLEKEDIKWSYDTEPFEIDSVPDHGFWFPHAGDVVWMEETHNTAYTFVNNDPDATLTLSSLRFYLSSDWCELGEWDCTTSGTLFYEVPGSVPVLPGATYPVPLDGVPNTNEYIYVAGTMTYQMPGSDPEIREFRDGHEEESRESVPTVTEWGLIGLAVLLLTAGAIVVGRRRAASA